MIEAGDLVRIKNEHLAAKKGYALFARYRKHKLYPKLRGKQVIARVLRVLWDEYDWRRHTRNKVVELDVIDSFTGRNQQISTDWLVVHRKGKLNDRRKQKIPAY